MLSIKQQYQQWSSYHKMIYNILVLCCVNCEINNIKHFIYFIEIDACASHIFSFVVSKVPENELRKEIGKSGISLNGTNAEKQTRNVISMFSIENRTINSKYSVWMLSKIIFDILFFTHIIKKQFIHKIFMRK